MIHCRAAATTTPPAFQSENPGTAGLCEPAGGPRAGGFGRNARVQTLFRVASRSGEIGVMATCAATVALTPVHDGPGGTCRFPKHRGRVGSLHRVLLPPRTTHTSLPYTVRQHTSSRKDVRRGFNTLLSDGRSLTTAFGRPRPSGGHGEIRPDGWQYRSPSPVSQREQKRDCK